ncbi:hypothetical protein AMST5_02159 [freshwater sediment metagenome]|uniref:Toprim domain-containing protein n=1 Tax=freshwater sediment metagenome TaxID=556182 RepID=A0AA48M2W9_9ZZZZ
MEHDHNNGPENEKPASGAETETGHERIRKQLDATSYRSSGREKQGWLFRMQQAAPACSDTLATDRVATGVARSRRDHNKPLAPAAEGPFTAFPFDLLHLLVGGDVSSDGQEILAPGPGHSPLDRSMSVRPSSANADGFVVHSFSIRTPAYECKRYIQFLIDRWLSKQLNGDVPAEWIEQTSSIAGPLDTAAAQEKRIKSAKWQWNRADRNLGEALFAYLRSRALELSDDLIGRVVRYEPNGRWYGPHGDQKDKNGLSFTGTELMLLAMRDVLSDEGRAIQAVRLPHTGKRPARKVKGLAKNAAIKLTAHEDILAAGEVAIAEGFESALAARMLGYQNVWACVNSGNVASFPLIEGVRKLTILAEVCPENEAAREECALRWFEAGREVTIALPDHGKDFNDDLVERMVRKTGGCNG